MGKNSAEKNNRMCDVDVDDDIKPASQQASKQMSKLVSEENAYICSVHAM